MTDQLQIIQETSDGLSRYFDDFTVEPAQGVEQLKQKLTAVLIYLLLNQMEKLLGILYRIDVSERKVKEIFKLSNPEAIAPELAQLIIDREMQKVTSRLTYSTKDVNRK